MLRRFCLLVSATLLLGSNGGDTARAATPEIVDGELAGASGVLVDGTLYDVTFRDGTCAELFDGCDDVSDFPFTTAGAASKASQALLEQVLLGSYDDEPDLTRGCENRSVCNIATPYGPSAPSGSDFNAFPAGIAQNESSGRTDRTNFFAIEDLDLTKNPKFVFALWTRPAASATPDASCQKGFGNGSDSVPGD